jgi:Zn-dependent peptidase ImmA (M78 family)/transcriptional regulator with XRE-family HTH domain
MNHYATQIGERIRLAREANDMTQEAFAKALGHKNHQTISAIETGLRQLQPDELANACHILKRPLSFFTDPYVVTETRAFSYRAKPNSKDIDAFERRAHNLISANRRFREILDEPAAPIGQQLRGLTRQSTVYQTTLVGERVCKALRLGDPPAIKLREAIEATCKVMVLFVDAPQSISGAACHLPDGDFILINRIEASFRRHFDLGHELFHILTWIEMPPERLDPELEGKEKPKVEKLADAFTAGLLMPYEVVAKRWQSRQPNQDIHDAILESAKELRVSGTAMYWRLVNTCLLNKSEQESVDTEKLSRPDDNDPSGRPNVFNADFVRRLHTVLQRGLLSARKASELLDCDPEDLQGICAAYGHPSPVCASTPQTNAAAPC